MNDNIEISRNEVFTEDYNKRQNMLKKVREQAKQARKAQKAEKWFPEIQSKKDLNYYLNRYPCESTSWFNFDKFYLSLRSCNKQVDPVSINIP